MLYQYNVLCWTWYRLLDIYDPNDQRCIDAKNRASAFWETIMEYRC